MGFLQSVRGAGLCHSVSGIAVFAEPDMVCDGRLRLFMAGSQARNGRRQKSSLHIGSRLRKNRLFIQIVDWRHSSAARSMLLCVSWIRMRGAVSQSDWSAVWVFGCPGAPLIEVDIVGDDIQLSVVISSVSSETALAEARPIRLQTVALERTYGKH